MLKYDDFPPVSLFIIVLRSCPKAALLYAWLWKLKSKNNQFLIKRKEIKKRFLISPTRFKNLLMDLAIWSALSFDEGEKSFLISMAPVDEPK